MKKFLVFSICAALFSLVSCVKDNGDNGGVVVVTPETISAKWLVEGESNYESFEFTQSGNYIVIEQGFRSTSGGVHFGTYDIDGNVLKMHGFGELTADDLKSGSFNFTLKLDSDTKTVLLMAIKQPEMANTTKTDLLCRTWVTVNETIPELDEGYDYIEKDIVVLFSKSGSYLVYNEADLEETGGVGLSQWKWSDSSETGFLYTWNWDNWDPEYGGYIEIYQLKGEKLVAIERMPDEPKDEVSVFKAVKN